MGVRREDKAFRDSLDVILEKEKPAIAAILDAYSIPRT